MNKCNHCNVYIDESVSKCPLCQGGVNRNTKPQNLLYPDYININNISRRHFILKLELFIAMLIIGACLFINLLTNTKHLWFLYIIGPVLYILLLVNHTILAKAHIGTKILLQVLGISSVLLMTDLVSGYYRWSVNIVIPLLFIATILAVTLMIFIKKKLWDDYVGYIIVYSFLGLIPILLYSVGVSDSIWASAASALYSTITIGILFLIPGWNFKNEFVRRFHF